MSRPSTNDSIPVRLPGRILTPDLWRDDPEEHPHPAGGDAPIQELTAYRLNRLEAEVLAPARSLARPEQRLRRMISAYATLAITDPGVMTLLPGERRAPAASEQPVEVRRRLRSFTDALEDNLEEILRAQDRQSALDSRVAAQSLLGIIHFGVCSHRTEARLSRDEAAAQITFLALHGLVAGSPAARNPAQPRGLNAA